MPIFPTCIMLIILFLAGITVQKFFNHTFSFTHAFMIGFLSLLAIFHVICYPLFCLNTSFSLLFWTYSVIVFALSAAGIFLLLQTGFRDTCLLRIKAIGQASCQEWLLTLAFIGVAGFYLFISLDYVYETSDDSYYLPRVMEIIAQNQLGVSHGFSWSGLTATSFSESVDASTLECWKAYWSYLFRLHPTVFCRNTLSLIIHFTSWCTLYQAYRSITSYPKSGMSCWIFLIVYLLFSLRDNQTASNAAYWSLRYPAQGKSILISIIYPALVYGCAQIISCGKQKISWPKWAMLALIFTAGIASTIIGVYWPFLCCLTMGIPYLLLERAKDFHKLLLPLILASLPVIIYAGISYLTITTEQTHYLESTAPLWEESITQGLNVNRLDIFLICLLFLFACGNKTAKMTLGGSIIMLFATLVNPLLIDFVATNLTSGSVYFRLFWMIPVYFLPAYAATEIFSRCTLKSRNLSVYIIAAVVFFSAGLGAVKVGPREMFHAVNTKVNINLGCERRTNPYGLSETWYEVSEKMLRDADENERVRVMWLLSNECFLRQYSEKFELLGACRMKQWVYFDQPLEENAVAPVLLQQEFMQNYRQDVDDPEQFLTQLIASKIEYICVKSTSGFAERTSLPSGFELFFSDESITIYRIRST